MMDKLVTTNSVSRVYLQVWRCPEISTPRTTLYAAADQSHEHLTGL
ncbi:hypothetical protein [Nocardia miyunensis]|nr:hypothetical protein [Nocardia miyunensis]